MFHDDMIMYVIINDQQSFMATINISSAWSTLIIAMNRWEFMHIWTVIIHTCMNSHLFIAMINVDHTDDVLIVAMKDNWSCMKILFIASYHEPYWAFSFYCDCKLELNWQVRRCQIQRRWWSLCWSTCKIKQNRTGAHTHRSHRWGILRCRNHSFRHERDIGFLKYLSKILDFAITNAVDDAIKSFDDLGSKGATGHEKSQSHKKGKGAKKHKRAKNSKRSKNHDKKKKNGVQ